LWCSCILLTTACAQNARSDKDLKGPQIDGIYIHLSYTLGYGGGVVMKYDPYLLLKDGTIYRNLLKPPKELDIEKSRQAEPKMWGRWQKSGNSIIVEWHDGKRETWDKHWHIARPARKAERLKGRFSSMTGGGNTAMGGTFSIAVFNDYAFSDDGRFTRGGAVGATDTSLAAGGKTGESRGTYVIDDYTIELRLDNGKVERLVFYFYPDSDDVIGIGNKVFVLKK
jgi:hypothetical protein